MSVLAETTARGDVLIRRGVTTRWGIRWEHSSDGRLFRPVDLTGWTGQITLRSDGSEVWLSRPVTCDMSGLVEVVLAPDDTAAPVWGSRPSGQWRVDLTSPDGHVERLADGYFHLEA